MAALVFAAAMTFTLGQPEAQAAPRCAAPGAPCKRNNNCCSGQCVLGTSSARRPVFGVCAPLGAPNGEACSTNSQCASGHCADGVCCNSACTGSCFTCDGGTCAPKAAGEQCDDGLFCTKTDACDGSGSCQGTGATCPLDSQSEECSICLEATDSCAHSEGVCGRVPGEACSAWYECSSNFCVEGVCCESDCSGSCESCSGTKTGYNDGTCAPVLAGTDPDSECPEGTCVTGLCDGAWGCGAVERDTDPADDCPEGPCVTGLCGGGGVCGVLSDTTPCNDGVACSQTDRCDGLGSCVSQTPNGCGRTAAGQECSCDEVSDTCSNGGEMCFP